MEDSNIKIDFSFTNEFGEESRLTKTFTNSVLFDRNEFEFLVEEFKLFMLASGYGESDVNSIKIVEEE
jgi:hypothetical protein